MENDICGVQNLEEQTRGGKKLRCYVWYFEADADGEFYIPSLGYADSDGKSNPTRHFSVDDSGYTFIDDIFPGDRPEHAVELSYTANGKDYESYDFLTDALRRMQKEDGPNAHVVQATAHRNGSGMLFGITLQIYWFE